MSNYIAMVFKTDIKAREALRKIWDMDESAVLADISECWPEKLDDAVNEMGGIIYRKFDVGYFGDSDRPYYSPFLYPYYYDPLFY